MTSEAIQAPSLERSREAVLRGQIAAGTRMLTAEGLLGYSGHLSARVPGRDALLIQPFDLPRTEVTGEQLLLCDFEGAVLEGQPGVKPPSEVFIHTEIYRAREDVQSIVHNHPQTATLFTLAQGAVLAPMKNHAYRWAGGIPTFPDPGHINTPALGRALAECLGQCHAALIRAHGAVVVAESVPGAFVDAVHFEENAEAAFRAAQLGPLLPLSAAEIETFASRFKRGAHLEKLWAFYLDKGFASGLLPSDWRSRLR